MPWPVHCILAPNNGKQWNHSSKTRTAASCWEPLEYKCQGRHCPGVSQPRWLWQRQPAAHHKVLFPQPQTRTTLPRPLPSSAARHEWGEVWPFHACPIVTVHIICLQCLSHQVQEVDFFTTSGVSSSWRQPLQAKGPSSHLSPILALILSREREIIFYRVKHTHFGQVFLVASAIALTTLRQKVVSPSVRLGKLRFKEKA